MITITWKRYIKDCQELKRKIKGFYKGIVIIPKGGLFVGAIVSQKFEGLPIIVDREPVGYKNYLIIDDLVDTGKTLKNVEGKIAVLYWKPKSIVTPDFYVRQYPDKWISFPYEI